MKRRYKKHRPLGARKKRKVAKKNYELMKPKLQEMEEYFLKEIEKINKAYVTHYTHFNNHHNRYY